MHIPSEIHIYHHIDQMEKTLDEKGRIIPLDDPAMNALISRVPYAGAWRARLELKQFMEENNLRFYQIEK